MTGKPTRQDIPDDIPAKENSEHERAGNTSKDFQPANQHQFPKPETSLGALLAVMGAIEGGSWLFWGFSGFFDSHKQPILADICFYLFAISNLAVMLIAINKALNRPGLILAFYIAFCAFFLWVIYGYVGGAMPSVEMKWAGRYLVPMALTAIAALAWLWAFRPKPAPPAKPSPTSSAAPATQTILEPRMFRAAIVNVLNPEAAAGENKSSFFLWWLKADSAGVPKPILYSISTAVYVRLVNVSNFPFTIESYSLESQNTRGDWEKRTIVPAEAGTLISTTDRQRATEIQTQNAFSRVVRDKAIQPQEIVAGWIYFNRRSGDELSKTRLRIKDTLGREMVSLLEPFEPDQQSAHPLSPAYLQVGKTNLDVTGIPVEEWAVGTTPVFSTPATATASGPRFKEEDDYLEARIGEMGYAIKIPRSNGDGEVANEMLLGDGTKLDSQPFKIHVLSGKIYIDATYWDGKERVDLKDNKIIGKPPGWDFNANDNAMELVDQQGRPVFQVLYQSDSSVMLKGGFYISDNKVMVINEIPEVVSAERALYFRAKLKPIFKHPQWKYPGQMEDLPLPPTPWRHVNELVRVQLDKWFPPGYKKKIIPRTVVGDTEAEQFAHELANYLKGKGLDIAPVEVGIGTKQPVPPFGVDERADATYLYVGSRP